MKLEDLIAVNKKNHLLICNTNLVSALKICEIYFFYKILYLIYLLFSTRNCMEYSDDNIKRLKENRRTT